MLAQVTNAIPDVVKLLHDVAPSISATDWAATLSTLLAISKLAQVAYKHWTTEGSKMDTVMKTIGVVQEPTAATVVANTVEQINKPVSK